MIKMLRKFEKLNFIKKILKLEPNIDNHSINSRNYSAAHRQALEEVPETLVPGKMIKKSKRFKKLEKIANVFSLILKS